ncbi:MAG TPA: PPC domain-containing protein [Longimicrobiales bacterium]|nr:PPC domain-containing protein [Longimicrobiales bacterium]
MRYEPRFIGLTALLCMAFAGDASAQARPPLIRLGETVRSALTGSDPVLSTGDSFKLFRLTAAAGQSLRFVVDGPDIMPQLQIALPVGGLTEVLANRASDGDRLLVHFVPRTDGEYLVAVVGGTAGVTGSFTLTVVDVATLPPPPTRPLPRDQPVTATLGATAAYDEDEDLTYDLYSVSGRAGEEIVITLRSDHFDAYLAIGTMDGSVFAEVDANDDGLLGTDSRLRFTFPADGDYILRAAALGEGLGEYTVRAGTAGAPTPPRAIERDTTISEVMTDDAMVDEDDHLAFYYYTFRAEADEILEIIMLADDFDPYLEVGTLANGEFLMIENDDDSFGELNARILFNVPRTGEYVIRAVSLDGAGAFRLRVGRPGALGAGAIERDEFESRNRVLPAGAARAGVQLTGEIGADGRAFMDWTYAATAGSRLRIELSSTVMDTYLQVGRMVDGTFEELYDDDDGGDGTNSLLTLTPTESEELIIRVSRYGGEGVAYTLSITDRPPAPASPSVQPLTAGREVVGRLDHADAELSDGSRYEHWTYSAQRNERLVITLRSTAFDAYLSVGRMPDNGAFIEVANNDDAAGAEGTDARVVMIVREAGEYVIRVNTFGPDQAGEFRLLLESTRAGAN